MQGYWELNAGSSKTNYLAHLTDEVVVFCTKMIQNDFLGGHLVSPGLCLKWAACGDTGFICSFIFSFMNSFFPSLIHPFSNRNICVANKCLSTKHYLRKIVCQQGRPLLSFGITQSLSVSEASSTALVPCGGMTSDVGPINATSNQGSTHAKNCFCCSIKVRKNCFQVMLGETNDAICCRL